MALSSKSLILYNFEITTLNRSIDFVIVSGGPTKYATLRLGFYSLTDLTVEIARAMFEADPTHVYACSVNRNISFGTENRISISTSGPYLDLLFGSGPRLASSAGPIIGFAIADQTGSTSYAGSASAGTVLIPEYIGYTYLGPEFDQKVFGSVNVSASGLKEAIVFSIQEFITVEFKYEPKLKVISEWNPFFSWAIRQRAFEFTPEISDPNTVYNVTLERTDGDGKGLGYRLKEQIPSFPNHYTTGQLQFRKKPV